MKTEAQIRNEMEKIKRELEKIKDLPDDVIVQTEGLPTNAKDAKKELRWCVYTLMWILEDDNNSLADSRSDNQG